VKKIYSGEIQPGYGSGGANLFSDLFAACSKAGINHLEAPVKNRRRAPRAKVSLPVRVLGFDSNCPEEIVRTSNMSREGLYFETSARHYLEQYFRNGKLLVTRNFHPDDITNLDEAGQIIRVDSLPDGKLGVSIRILSRLKPEFTEAPGRSSEKA